MYYNESVETISYCNKKVVEIVLILMYYRHVIETTMSIIVTKSSLQYISCIATKFLLRKPITTKFTATPRNEIEVNTIKLIVEKTFFLLLVVTLIWSLEFKILVLFFS